MEIRLLSEFLFMIIPREGADMEINITTVVDLIKIAKSIYTNSKPLTICIFPFLRRLREKKHKFQLPKRHPRY